MTDKNSNLSKDWSAAAGKADANQELYRAVRGGDVLAAQRALDAGAKASGALNDMGTTLLHIAAGGASCALVDMLIAAGGNVNAIDAAGKSPLDYAVDKNMPANAKALLDAGAKMKSLQILQGLADMDLIKLRTVPEVWRADKSFALHMPQRYKLRMKK